MIFRLIQILKMPGGGDTVTIIYPQGCKEVTEDLTPDELIRRLKVSQMLS